MRGPEDGSKNAKLCWDMTYLFLRTENVDYLPLQLTNTVVCVFYVFKLKLG